MQRKEIEKKRGICIVDAVGAYNILRKYHAVSGKEIDMPVTHLGSSTGVMDAPLKLRNYAS